MISLTTKAFVRDNRVINFKIPENTNIESGEYEIVIVIDTTPAEKKMKAKLTFSEHDYQLSNPDTTFSRENIYGEFGR